MSELDEILDDLGPAVEGSDSDGMDDWAAALEEQQFAAAKIAEASHAPAPASPGAAAHPHAANFDDLDSRTSPAESKCEDVNLDMILDVPVTLSMEIGRTKLNIRNLLQLTQGSVVELDRLAGEPMDVLVNGTLIAHGEVVVVNDKFGIRLLDVVSPAERVRKLK